MAAVPNAILPYVFIPVSNTFQRLGTPSPTGLPCATVAPRDPRPTDRSSCVRSWSRRAAACERARPRTCLPSAPRPSRRARGGCEPGETCRWWAPPPPPARADRRLRTTGRSTPLTVGLGGCDNLTGRPCSYGALPCWHGTGSVWRPCLLHDTDFMYTRVLHIKVYTMRNYSHTNTQQRSTPSTGCTTRNIVWQDSGEITSIVVTHILINTDKTCYCIFLRLTISLSLIILNNTH